MNCNAVYYSAAVEAVMVLGGGISLSRSLSRIGGGGERDLSKLVIFVEGNGRLNGTKREGFGILGPCYISRASCSILWALVDLFIF